MIITMSSIRYNYLEAEHRVNFLLHNDTSLSKWTLHDSSSSLNKFLEMLLSVPATMAT